MISPLERGLELLARGFNPWRAVEPNFLHQDLRRLAYVGATHLGIAPTNRTYVDWHM